MRLAFWLYPVVLLDPLVRFIKLSIPIRPPVLLDPVAPWNLMVPLNLVFSFEPMVLSDSIHLIVFIESSGFVRLNGSKFKCIHWSHCFNGTTGPIASVFLDPLDSVFWVLIFFWKTPKAKTPKNPKDQKITWISIKIPIAKANFNFCTNER